MTDATTVVSYNRPLTRAARRALEAYGIVDTTAVDEPGRWTVVTLEDQPPEDLLEHHELALERAPDVVYETDTGDRVEIYTDPAEVRVDGHEASISPADAREHAREQGWERVAAGD